MLQAPQKWTPAGRCRIIILAKCLNDAETTTGPVNSTNRRVEPREPRFHVDLVNLALARQQYADATLHAQRAVACNPQ